MRFDITALRVALDEDLLPLSVLLHQHQLPHRIYEEAGEQVLKVSGQAQADKVKQVYRAWRDGKLNLQLEAAPSRSAVPGQRTAIAWHAAPVTLMLIALSFGGFLLVYLRAPLEWVSLLSFNPFIERGGSIQFEPIQGQYWRLVTPAFLHFGWMHIVFNSLWLWELGGRVEQALGSLHMLGLFLVTAVVSNVSQYAFGGPALFGGMSGVVYGLLGFSWVAATLQPRWAFRPSKPIMLLMVGWLVLCILGVIESLGFGSVANAAHLGGLLSGAALGGCFGLLSRYNPDFGPD